MFTPAKKQKSLLARLISNLPYKILALVIACIIWYIVQGEEILEINRRLDVRFEVPQGLAIREGNTVSRDVTLRGPRVALSNFSSKPIEATIRLPGKKGSQRYRLDKEMIAHWDNRIKMTIHDPFVTIFMDDRASRSIPVKVALTGSPKNEVSIKDVQVEPAEITVTGLKSDIQKLQELSTEIVGVSGINESKSFPVPLSLMGLPELGLSTQQVVVKINLYEGMTTKVLDAVPIEVRGIERLSSVRPRTVQVTLRGPGEELAKLTAQDVDVVVDASGLAPGRYERDVTVHLLQKNLTSTVEPSKVWLEIYNQKKLH